MRALNPALAEALQFAYAAHQAGNLAEAERAYRLVLRTEPDQFDALHLLGVLEAQRGNNTEANRLLDRALNVDPRSADALNNRANVLRDLKRHDEALASVNRALDVRQEFPEALNNRGNVLHDLRRHAEALASYDQALAVKPDYAKALVNRADVLRDLRRYDEALASCERAIAIAPGLAEAFNNRGRVLHELNRLGEALADFDKALAAKPDSVSALVNRIRILRELHRYDDALETCRRTLAVMPSAPKILSARGDVLRELKRYDEALASYDLALAVEPADTDALCGRSDALLSLGRREEALECCERALRIEPSLPEAINHRGNVLRALSRDDEALSSYGEALRINPNFPEAHYNFAALLNMQGWREQAVAHFERALSLKPDFAEAHFGLCVAELAIVYRDETEIARRRAAYEARLRTLIDAVEHGRVAGDLATGLGSTAPFFLAYQGRSDRELHRLYGSLACRIVRDRYPPAPLSAPAGPGEPIRVGIVSDYFRHHSAWKMRIKGWLKQLDRNRFRIFGYHTGNERDGATDLAASLCERFVEGLDSIEDCRGAIIADSPHVLLYPAIGMDGHSVLLAAQRLAPVQCCSWSHPVTTGLPTVDYFLSNELMEPPNGQEHYTEPLIRLPNLGVYYEPIEVKSIPVDRAQLGLRRTASVFWCAQSLFKYLPRYDGVFPRIARALGDSQFVFVPYRAGTAVTQVFQQRLRKAFAAFGLDPADHCVFLPRLDQARFVAASGQCDVFLDSIGWSGCNTTLESLAHDLPIVTLRGDLMRSRHAAAILERMGITDTITDTVDDFISTAVRLGRDVPWRNEIKARIAANKHKIYRDRASIEALEEFLDQAVRR